MKVVLIPQAKAVKRAELEQMFPAGAIFACDFYVSGVEEGLTVPGGYEMGRIINVDHHAPTERMSRWVSSTNLAIERVVALGPLQEEATVVINHTDCDSVLCAAILAGSLPPEQVLGDAAVAADHSGIENPIADLLQSVQHRRDYEFSLRNAKLLLTGHQVEPEAADDLQVRRKKRELAAQNLGKFQTIGAVAFAELDDSTDSEFYASLLPSASVILLAMPRKDDPGRKVMKLRLATNAPPGLTLNALHLNEFDPSYGGRWNAGSNKRGAGTTLTAFEYAEKIAKRVAEAEREVGDKSRTL